MPELPEVETIKNDLAAKIKGKEISDVKILWRGALNISAKKFVQLIKNAKILNISRRAKILILTLSNNYSLFVHLKMTGQLLYESGIKNYSSFAKATADKKLRIIIKNPLYKYARVIFFFTDKSILAFNDLRKFGYVKIIPQSKVQNFINSEKFGPEPLDKDFTLEKFKEILKKYPRRRIKQDLMDPAAIAGIGNIYADEICFYAKAKPTKQINNLTTKQTELLFKGIKKILSRAIELRGSSIENYVDAGGRKGDYVKELKVYGRENEKCFRCKGKIKRVKLGGRSSYFCPHCQK
ncbi:MAG: bifunctional DNA-formamidopyrimidine glycosylase/DNA-(apurinic or apyrimidinic site) lyase [Patescibacteria group bacterium]